MTMRIEDDAGGDRDLVGIARLIGGSERDPLFSRLRGSTKKKGTNGGGTNERGERSRRRRSSRADRALAIFGVYHVPSLGGNETVATPSETNLTIEGLMLSGGMTGAWAFG